MFQIYMYMDSLVSAVFVSPGPPLFEKEHYAGIDLILKTCEFSELDHHFWNWTMFMETPKF